MVGDIWVLRHTLFRESLTDKMKFDQQPEGSKRTNIRLSGEGILSREQKVQRLRDSCILVSFEEEQ